MARYIDADELLQSLKRQYGEELGWQGTTNMSDVGAMIEDAPTADVVEVKHGKWVNRGDGDWSCDRCGELFSFDAWGDVHPKDDCGCNYCPNCGAKMDGGEE